MHSKNWVLKSMIKVTCLANNRKTLGICSNKLRTPENLVYTNNSIHKQSLKRSNEKTEKRSKSNTKQANGLTNKGQPNSVIIMRISS